MTWKATLLAVLRAGFDKLVAWYRAAADYVVDPPPGHLKAYFWIVAATMAFGWLVGATVISAVKSVFVPVHQAAPVQPIKRVQPVYLIPRLPDVIVTTPPPAPVVTAKTIAPTKAVKHRTKRKCDAVFC